MNLSRWMSWRKRNFFRRKGKYEYSFDLGKDVFSYLKFKLASYYSTFSNLLKESLYANVFFWILGIFKVFASSSCQPSIINQKYFAIKCRVKLLLDRKVCQRKKKYLLGTKVEGILKNTILPMWTSLILGLTAPLYSDTVDADISFCYFRHQKSKSSLF